MAAVSAGIGLLSAGIGYLASERARKSKEASDKKQEQMNASALELARQREEEERRMFGPVREKLAREAMSTEPAEYGKMAGEISKNYGALRQGIGAGGYGVSGGLNQAKLQAIDLGESAAKTAAYGDALNRQRNLAMSIAGMDRSGQYGQNLQNTLERQGTYWGQQSADAARAQQEGYRSGLLGAAQFAQGLVRRKPRDSEWETSTEADWGEND